MSVQRAHLLLNAKKGKKKKKTAAETDVKRARGQEEEEVRSRGVGFMDSY